MTVPGRGATFIAPNEIIGRHRVGQLDAKQGVVALARAIIAIEERLERIEDLLGGAEAVKEALDNE